MAVKLEKGKIRPGLLERQARGPPGPAEVPRPGPGRAEPGIFYRLESVVRTWPSASTTP